MVPQQVWTHYASRRLLARLLSTLICSIIIVVRPFSRFGGPWALLALTIKELVFSAQENLAQQVEDTILHLMGGLAGIGMSAFAKYISSFPPNGTVIARTVSAVFLVVLTFFGIFPNSRPMISVVSCYFTAGLLKSRLPRLTLSTRIACFIAIWMLTADIGLEHVSIVVINLSVFILFFTDSFPRVFYQKPAIISG